MIKASEKKGKARIREKQDKIKAREKENKNIIL